MTIYVEARYLGPSGHGFHYHNVYQLHVTQHWYGRITITATHGYLFKPVAGTRHAYKNLEALLRDWKIIRLVDSRYL